ncbi:MAG: UDP-3-O-(3-hydroxymyristoyl)glucosamine N-acyltransferase [Chitinophagaceae bacterium]|jgi:UDP-3-O-[3-hydroxymyristoyl] glucosamine N-acyltransferase|nr:UDP-3-O-(3-hydroxymyristoyl)glucosamine N-acyltransferase [Chitinophagaceae bacterium]
MKFPAPVQLSDVASWIGARIIGDAGMYATGINEIHRVETGDLAFVDHPKYYRTCIESAASFIIIDRETDFPEGKVLLVVDQPFEAYLTIVRRYRSAPVQTDMISGDAVISEGTILHPGVCIGAQVSIGRDCVIHPNVTIRDHCIIGDRVVIQSGSVIGSEPFYYNAKRQRDVWYKRMESCGRVIIEDDVEIGASCTIDRGVTHDTRIGAGTKMDNMVHIGHDTIIGRNCLFAAQVAVAGAVEIGEGVILWGQVGVSKTLTIGAHAVVLSQSGVAGSLEGGRTYFGTPAMDALQKKRELVWVKRISEMWDRLIALERRSNDGGHSGS